YIKFSFVWIQASIREAQVELESMQVTLPFIWIGMISDELGERLLTDIHYRRDRIHLGNRGQRSSRRADKIANVRFSYSHDAIDRRGDLCVAKIHLGLSYRGFCRLHISLRR